jgi:long-chain acyl-CoA synthetase
MDHEKKIWLQHYEKNVPASLEYPRIRLFDFLEQSTGKYPENRALSYLGNTISYAELDRLVNKAANIFLQLGVRKGDRVALYLANTPQYIIALYGALKIGAIAVPINPLYQSAEVTYELQDCGANTIVVMSRFYPLVQKIRHDTELQNIIVTNVKAFFPPITRLLFTLFKEKEDRVTIGPNDHQFEILMQQSRESRPEATVESDDVALLQYTSGTTGTPKGVMLSHYNLVVNALQCRTWVTDTKEGEEVILGWLPFFHSFGMTACLNFTISCAGTLVLIPNPKDLPYILKTIEKEQVSIMPGVPTMYAALGNYKDIAKYNLRSIRACISGGAPLLEGNKRRFETVTGAKLVEGYGLSEASPVTHANPINGLNKIGCIGIPMPDTECRIVDMKSGEQGLEPGKTGELIIRAPQVMLGYWNSPEATGKVIRDGWLYTGDIVRMDEDGYFQIIDREKDIIIVKGFNVFPTEIEKVICAHPKVQEAAVVGIPHEYKGEEIKAYVILHEGCDTTEDELIEYLRTAIARYKIPSSIEFIDSLPKNVMGKLLRRLLLAQEMERRGLKQE